MDSHKLLVFILPTNEPDTFFNFFAKGIKYLTEVNDYCTFNFNFQKPWTEDQINDALELIDSYGFKYEYVYHPEGYKFDKPYVPITRIRNDTVITKDGMLYALLDDDMVFQGVSDSVSVTAGDQYLQVIDYMLRFPKCALVLMGGSLIRKVPKYHIGMIDTEVSYLTGKGYVVRSLQLIDGYDNLSPDEVLTTKDAFGLCGGFEEKLIAGYRLSKGYYPARLGFSKTRHYENQYSLGNGYFKNKGTNKSSKVLSGGDEYDWLNHEVTESNINKYIRDNFYLPDKRNSVRLDNITRCVDKRIYLDNGGVPLNEETYSDHLFDYTCLDVKNSIDKQLQGEGMIR